MAHLATEDKIQQVFPYLIVRNAAAAVYFYKRVFGAEEAMRLASPAAALAMLN